MPDEQTTDNRAFAHFCICYWFWAGAVARVGCTKMNNAAPLLCCAACQRLPLLKFLYQRFGWLHKRQVLIS
jgi:hypothetical protein